MKTSSALLVAFAILVVAVGIILIVGSTNPAMVTGQTTNSPPAQNSTSTTAPTTSVPPSTPMSTNSEGDTYDVAISGFAFSPQTMTIDAGDSIQWTNMDSATHTVVSDTGSMINSGDLATGQSYTQLFTTPGTYTYHCSIHPDMTGTIIVNAPSTSTSTSSGSSGGY